MNLNKIVVEGATYCAFDIAYKYKGKTYSFNIWATSQSDAEARLQAIKESAKVDSIIELSLDNNIFSKN